VTPFEQWWKENMEEKLGPMSENHCAECGALCSPLGRKHHLKARGHEFKEISK